MFAEISAFQHCIRLRRTESIRRGMACTAMPETLYEIGATIPHVGFFRVSFESAFMKIERIPSAHHFASAERPGKIRRLVRLSHGCQGVQKSLDRTHVVGSRAGEPWIRKSRIEVLSIAAYARMHGLVKIFV